MLPVGPADSSTKFYVGQREQVAQDAAASLSDPGGPETWMFRRLPTDVKQGIITIIIISIQDNVDYIILKIRLLLYLSFITLDITTVSVISMLPRSSNVFVNMFATFGLYCLIFIQRVALHWI